MFEAIKECDEYPVNFLKGKFHKNVVGALFSLIVSILQYITWGYTGAYYFFQKSHVTQTLLPASSFKQTPFFSDELSTIRIRLFQQNDTSQNELKYLTEYYRLATITIKNKTFIMTIYPNTFEDDYLVYNVSYSSLFENFNPLGFEMNFPTIGYESCSTIKTLKNSFSNIIVNGSEYLEGCRDINDEFYEKVKGKIFVYMFQVVESFLTRDYKINTTTKFIPFPFVIKKNSHIVYETSQRKIAVLYDDKVLRTNTKYKFFMNWLSPKKTQIKSYSKEFDFQQLFSIRFQDQITTYNIYITPLINCFFRFGGPIHTLIRSLNCFSFVWTSYYLAKLICVIYRQKFKNVISDREFEHLTYCKWLGIRLGCSTRSRELNRRLKRMRLELSLHFEQLYSKKIEPIKEDLTSSLVPELSVELLPKEKTNELI